MLILAIIFFSVGFLEMVFWALQTKALIRDRIFSTFLLTFISVVIWYYVVENVAKNIDRPLLMIIYSLGCAMGTALTIKFDMWLEKLSDLRLKTRKYMKKQIKVKKRKPNGK